MSRASKFFKLSLRDKSLFLESAVFLAAARIMIAVAPFRWIARRLGEQASPEETLESIQRRDQAVRIANMLQTAARNTPWKTNCLVQSIAAALMLRRRKINGAVYFGARSDDSGRFEAHAWTSCGDVLMTGDHEEATYVKLMMFRFPKQSRRSS